MSDLSNANLLEIYPSLTFLEPIYPTSLFRPLDFNRDAGGFYGEYRFHRVPSEPWQRPVLVEIVFYNDTSGALHNIRITGSRIFGGMKMSKFPPIEVLPQGDFRSVLFYVDYNDFTLPVAFYVACDIGVFLVRATAPVGDLLHAVNLEQEIFESCCLIPEVYDSSVTVYSPIPYPLDILMQIGNFGVCDGSNLECIRLTGLTRKLNDLVMIVIENKFYIKIYSTNVFITSKVKHDIEYVFRRMQLDG